MVVDPDDIQLLEGWVGEVGPRECDSVETRKSHSANLLNLELLCKLNVMPPSRCCLRMQLLRIVRESQALQVALGAVFCGNKNCNARFLLEIPSFEVRVSCLYKAEGIV
jgi:hypothetical protein